MKATFMRTVLLLEDELFIAIDMEDMLRDEGIADVVSFDTCAAALEWLAAHKPDLAVVDPRLKDGSCGPVARHLAERAIPFVVYSGDPASATDSEPAFSKGVRLNKPSTPPQVAAALAKAFGIAQEK